MVRYHEGAEVPHQKRHDRESPFAACDACSRCCMSIITGKLGSDWV